MKLFVFLCIFQMILINAFAAGDADFRAIQKAHDQLQLLNKPQSTCIGCAFEDKGNSCFKFLDKMYKDDFTKGITLSGGAYRCHQSAEAPGIANRFSNVQGLQNQFQSMYPEIGTLNHKQIRDCTTDSGDLDSVSRYKVSKFYYYMKKFNESATRATEEIAAIDSLLGVKAPQACIGKGTLTQAFNRCEELNKKCKPSNENLLEAAAKESAVAEGEYLNIKKDIQNIDRQCLYNAKDYDQQAKNLSAQKPVFKKCQYGSGTRDFSKICTEYTFDTKKKIEACRRAKDNLLTAKLKIEDENPWFRSENYHQARKKKSVQESIKEYSLINRKELQKKISEFQDAGLCFNGFLDSERCDIGKIRKLLSSTIDLPELAKTNQNINSASVYLNVHTCVEIKNEFNAETVKTLKGAALDVGLTLGTMGLGSLVAFGKGAAAGLKAKRVAALAGVMGIDAYYASQSYIDVYNSCSSSAQKLDIAFQGERRSCPGPKSNLSQAHKEHSSCMTAVAMAGIDTAILGLPLVSIAAKRIMDARRGNKLAEEMSSETLTMGEKFNQIVGKKDPFLTGEAKEIGSTYKSFLKELPEDHGEVINLISQARRKGIPESKIKEAVSSCVNQ